MSTVYKRGGYQFQIYRRDNPPAHVHVKRSGKEAMFHLVEPQVVMENWGFGESELAEIRELLKSRGGTFLHNYWDKYHLNR